MPKLLQWHHSSLIIFLQLVPDWLTSNSLKPKLCQSSFFMFYELQSPCCLCVDIIVSNEHCVEPWHLIFKIRYPHLKIIDVATVYTLVPLFAHPCDCSGWEDHRTQFLREAEAWVPNQSTAGHNGVEENSNQQEPNNPNCCQNDPIRNEMN